MIIEPSTPSGIPSSRMSEKVVDNPPAYSDLESAHGRVRHHPPPPVHASIARNNGQSLTVPPPSVDQVHIFERKHNIEGTFYIDPLVPALDQSRRGKQKCNKPLPHASFRTRNGTIDLNLATTGDGQKTPKARITVSSRHGLIRLNLLSMPPSTPSMGLDVSSRHGDIVLFIPEGFSGVMQLSSRKGTMQVLPALSARMKIVKSSDREIIFMVGNADEGLNSSREASFCEASTRSGSIIVGMSGRDHYTPPAGFWKKLGGILRGDSKP